MRDLPALTVRQPWAGLIMAGVKTVENRSWVTHYRGELYVHASARPDTDAMSVLDEQEDLAGVDVGVNGAILGTVELYDIAEHVRDRWAIDGQWHWLLRRPRPMRVPVVMPGRQGLWRPGRAPTPALW